MKTKISTAVICIDRPVQRVLYIYETWDMIYIEKHEATNNVSVAPGAVIWHL